MALVIYRTAARPGVGLWLRDSAGNLIDFSAGYTFTFKIGTPGSAALLTKTTGITGATGAGTEPTGTPNVVIAFAAGELSGLTKGTEPWQLTATTGGLPRVFEGSVLVKDVIT